MFLFSVVRILQDWLAIIPVAAKFTKTENFQKVFEKIQNNDDDQKSKNKFIEKIHENMKMRKVLKFF